MTQSPLCGHCGSGSLRRMIDERAGIVWYVCNSCGRVVGEEGKL